MKKHLRIVFALGTLLAFLSSCSTDVDLLADGADVPIVYALLDLDADTNYVKITHTMKAPGTVINANNPDLTNYPGKLDVRLTEFCNGDSVRQFILDTITIQDKEDGFFYSPSQKLYYTTERLSQNQPGKNYSYRLYVVLPDRVVTADADVVGSDNFRIRSTVVDFSGGYHYLDSLTNRVTHEIWFNPAQNGGIYDAYMSFTFFERRGWTSDTIPHTITWHMGTYYQYYLPQYLHGDAFVITYFPYDIYKELDDYIGNDTLVPGLRRYLDDAPIRVTVTAGDRNLEDYVYHHNLSSGIPDESHPTNIKGGYGVVSTIKTVDREMRFGGTTVPELVDETKWGFKYVGGHL